jgi:ribosomal protein S17E
MNQECLEVVKLLKNDVAGYVTSGDSFELVQIPKSEVKTIADKLKKYSNIFNDQEVKSFLELANETEETSSSK